MSKAARQDQLRSLWATFKSQRPTEKLGQQMSFSDFDGLTLDEARVELRFVIDTLDALTAGSLSEMPFNAITTIQAHVQNLQNSFSQLITTRDQNSFQSFANNLDACAFQIRQLDVPFLISGGSQLEQTRSELSHELDQLRIARAEVEQLRDSVRTLITPAVAGSLSQSFTSRRDALLRGRIAWGIAAGLLAGAAVYATYTFSSVVGEAIGRISAGPTGSHEVVWAGIIIRSIVLLPLFAAFGVAFAQYKKERDFEEEYAHKAAVAASLPNYGDLARDATVRDQIVTGATAVIFTSPTAHYRVTDSPDKSIKSLAELLNAASKLVSKEK